MSRKKSAELEIEIVYRCKRKGLPSAQLIKQHLQNVWNTYGGVKPANLCLVFMNEAEHTALHLQFLNDPTPTDVMAFPYDDEDLCGEIVVNIDMAAQQCASFRKNFSQEILLYVVHGALHLIGFDDLCEASKQNMRIAEERILSS